MMVFVSEVIVYKITTELQCKYVEYCGFYRKYVYLHLLNIEMKV